MYKKLLKTEQTLTNKDPVTMRLSPDQVQAIRHAAQRVLGSGAQVLCQLHGALTLALGDRKIDIILKDANTPSAPVFEIAKRTGVLL